MPLVLLSSSSATKAKCYPWSADVMFWAPSHTWQWVTPRPLQDSPALWGDEGVSHVKDAHIWVALHVLLPVHIVVLDHVCGREKQSAEPGRLGSPSTRDTHL